LLEFCHVLCSGRCVIGPRCPQGADIVEIVCANHRRQPERCKSVRSVILEWFGFDRRGNWLGRQRLFADFAGNHERAARRTEPVLGGSTTASKSRSAALKDLFGQIDGDGDGKISKEEFETALGAGGTNLTQADSVFGKLDKDGDGSVSLKELASALKPKGHHHDRDKAGDGDGSGSDPLSQALQGASTTSVTNSDGSVTTSLNYADGSKVAMTSAAGKSSSASATSSYNFIEQMIQRQAQQISSAATSSLSLSV
jgi:EF-hand domain pair